MSGLSCGIVGLPNVGKSTFFNALTSAGAASSNYPFCTIDPNVGIVEVIDPRLLKLQELYESGRVVYATLKILDIAGLVAGASQGAGLGNKFLANIREVDAIIEVVRCFDTAPHADVIHVSGSVDPVRDIEVIHLELALADLQMVENVLPKLKKQLKSKKELQPTFDLLCQIKEQLNQNRFVRTLSLTHEERELLRPYPFLTAKKMLYVANVSEADLSTLNNKYVEQVRALAEKEDNLVIPICAKVEEEIAQLAPEERAEFLQTLGLQESGLQRVVKASFSMLGLITFLTAGEMEARAWTIPRGTTAADAAGEIHTDIKQGFIRAQVVSYDDIIAHGGPAGAKAAGKVRSEGKDYIVQDGDVILFYHHH